MTSLLHLVELMSDSHPGNRGEIRTTEVFTLRVYSERHSCHLNVTAYAGQKCKVQLLYHMNKVKCFRSWLRDKYYDDKDTYFVIG